MATSAIILFTKFKVTKLSEQWLSHLEVHSLNSTVNNFYKDNCCLLNEKMEKQYREKEDNEEMDRFGSKATNNFQYLRCDLPTFLKQIKLQPILQMTLFPTLNHVIYHSGFRKTIAGLD